jgi:hypothetical protein
MTDILSEVTPLSRGIIWLRKEEVVTSSKTYKWVDYLLDGLLTAKINAHSISPTGLLVGKNFGKDFYVFLSSSEIAQNEVTSFYTLLSPLLSSDEDILVIDETESYAKLLKITPEDLKKRFRVIK